ncbi:hypothetical protein DAPK24_039230 [Pichia kluyveri]|uniref:Uncharacterized protein n=1 Tax=Pichia kluyveri TaxID=36015 RepID=A0AAV5R7Z7_PICKL|nr:hypothetical protein DAPK24_039230 [Pichia kluyveri]
MLTLVQKAMESNQQYLFEIDAAILRNKQLQKVFANREVVSSRSHDARSRLKLLLKPSYNIQQLRPCFRFYGSPFRSISDYSQEFGDKERKCYRKVFEKAAEEDWSKRGKSALGRGREI